MSSPNPKVLDHSWELECQQRHNKEESEVNGVRHVHQSLRYVGFEALQRQGLSVDQARWPRPLSDVFFTRCTAILIIKREHSCKCSVLRRSCVEFVDREISGASLYEEADRHRRQPLTSTFTSETRG